MNSKPSGGIVVAPGKKNSVIFLSISLVTAVYLASWHLWLSTIQQSSEDKWSIGNRNSAAHAITAGCRVWRGRRTGHCEYGPGAAFRAADPSVQKYPVHPTELMDNCPNGLSVS